ncbi:hypothetical protein CDL12_26633 [Handroanthus impetiginosus]|uniref:F-box domain-containing protein n=1 Tax=Handroanthus impetiginosus TaxID=429701 RepID=A0A2G9G6C2_9LAMI|nr:hypothetical protein CDL12_26633 [Handroanthus impetiginosus]
MELPTDLMLDIFFRLECNDILICKGVCKAWYKILSDPNFSTDFVRHSPLLTLLVTKCCRAFSEYLFLIQVAAHGEFIWRPITPKALGSSKRNSIVKVIGSCNGLVFLLWLNFSFPRLKTEQVYFGNPLLGGCVALIEFKRLNNRLRYEEYKLGFVPSTNKIKLLRTGFDDDGRVEEAHIMTFREDDKWRKLKNPVTLWFPFTNGTCFNGAYLGVAGDDNADIISTFDLRKKNLVGFQSPLACCSSRMI